MGEEEIMDECEYEHEDSIFYDEKYPDDESYLDELQQEEELGDELDGEEIFAELTDYDYNDAYGLDSIEDLLKLDFLSIGEVEVDKFHFGTLAIAFEFYNRFAKSQGFSARKDKNWKNSTDETYMQRFVCFRQGYQLEKWYTLPNRKREPKTETRTGYEAQFLVKFVGVTGRWHVTRFSNLHNHELLEGRLSRLLPAHRSMSKAEIALMNNMRKSGISTSQVYALLASQSGGFDKLNYGPRDMYNQIAKAMREIPEDVGRALNYLEGMAANDKSLYYKEFRATVGRLLNLFWCDGLYREDYKLFGDVVAFDATYNKNKYRCPFVVFTGVNHHNQTIVFAACIVTDETDETYIWVLQQFLEAMDGRVPSSVITDGARAMKNAIEKVFPGTHHRLCAWHLLRNATTNMCSPRFTSKFRDCMLGDYEIPVFRNKWHILVEEFGVEEKEWLNEIYEKRRSWATCYIRGKFFAGFRTTSRCEGLHSLIGKYTKPHYDLSEFIEHFQRMLGHMRFREFYAEYESARGVPVMQTCIEPLEMCAADTYTREVFFLFRPILVRSGAMRVVDYQTRDNSIIYYVCRYAKPTKVWEVEWVDNGNAITCSCMRMESFGIPCEHIISVLVRRDVREIPKCLVLHRWTKKAKESMSESSSFTSELQVSNRLCILNECARMMSEVACATTERFHEARDLMLDLYSSYKALDEGNTPSKPRLGGGTNPKGHSGRKKPQRCSNCKKPGHNKTSCSKRNENAFSTQGSSTRQTDAIYDGECMDDVEYETQEWW
ncbi:protein FAR1-RELATED SEQUENCE 5-like [Arachis hypogaea]|nr:protein FAR1-RELATED SEQUENCE 5-like [Arachis hypogaea]